MLSRSARLGLTNLNPNTYNWREPPQVVRRFIRCLVAALREPRAEAHP